MEVGLFHTGRGGTSSILNQKNCYVVFQQQLFMNTLLCYNLILFLISLSGGERPHVQQEVIAARNRAKNITKKWASLRQTQSETVKGKEEELKLLQYHVRLKERERDLRRRVVLEKKDRSE